jgi:glycosyltransferase involved in cell wall biosynthesis
MGNVPQYYNSASRLNYCVIIPTYNNSKTLPRVIDGVLNYTAGIIVVNDGATDATPQILENYNDITVITFPKNKGKGAALRAGFIAAQEAGYDYAITIDSDGQHYPDDIPVFLNQSAQHGGALLIGSRNMVQQGVPKKSSFGNTFSNFWFWFETGNKLQDTQCGFRMYPLHKIPRKLYTNKFEFEIEVIVRSAWKGMPVKNVPVKVLYDPVERVSHFRPFIDFSRISVLNTILVIISLLYIKPRDIIRSIKKKSLKQFLLDNVLHSSDSPLKKTLSIMLGVFIGIAPLWGFQTILVLFLAYAFRLNKVIAFAFSNISIPPVIPLIIFASLKVGLLVVPGKEVSTNATTYEAVNQNIVQYLAGSILLATAMAFITGTAAYFIFISLGKNTVHKNA